MDVGVVVAVNVEVTVGASTVIDVVATVVVRVLVATVVVAVDDGAVTVHVWPGTGYLDEQKVTAGGKPFKTLATRPGSPPMHKGFGQDAQWARVAMLPSRMTAERSDMAGSRNVVHHAVLDNLERLYSRRPIRIRAIVHAVKACILGANYCRMPVVCNVETPQG